MTSPLFLNFKSVKVSFFQFSFLRFTTTPAAAADAASANAQTATFPESEKAVERRESKKIELTFLRRCATLSKDCEKQNSVEKQGWREQPDYRFTERSPGELKKVLLAERG